MSTPGLNRRDFLGRAAGLASGASLLGCGGMGQPMGRDGPLVLVEMLGGVDGLSLVVPNGDDEYHHARKFTRLGRSETLIIDGYRGLHPSLKRLHKRFERGNLAIVEGCGYPDPYYTHFRSFEVWHTGRHGGRTTGPGWLARLADQVWSERSDPKLVMHVGQDPSYSILGGKRPALCFQDPKLLRWMGHSATRKSIREALARPAGALTAKDRALGRICQRATLGQDAGDSIGRAVAAHEPAAVWERDRFSNAMRSIAAMIRASLPTRVYCIRLDNFDGHGATLRPQHARLLRWLDAGICALLDDVEGTHLGDRTVVMAFSEFGRRLQENRSLGTDHGNAGPMLIAGKSVRGGLHGAHPSLTDLDGLGNLQPTVDFRQVYASVLEQHFGTDSRTILGDSYTPLDVLGAL